MVDLLVGFFGQNNGVFSRRAQKKEFPASTAAKRRELETL
jgi:hypothetical protein